MYVPPAPGMAAPSSAQMRPSASARIAPLIQPNIASGPPIVAAMAGIVTNGPMPHICVMLIAVAWIGPILRSRAGCGDIAAPDDPGLRDGELTTYLHTLLGKFLNINLAGVKPSPVNFLQRERRRSRWWVRRRRRRERRRACAR